MSIRKNVIYYIKKNIFIVLVLIGLCPVLALSYAKFTINSESYRSNEMYISELLYSIKIDNKNTYTIDIEPGETEHTIEITSLSGISTNYKLAYLNNDNLEVRYASDYMDASFGGIVMTRTISLTIKNTSTEKQTLSLMVFGGYSFNDVDEVKALDTYTEIDTNYLHYDYETTALYVDNTRIDKLDSTKKYDLIGYTCSNGAKVTYDSNNRNIIIHSDNQTKCSLYFEEHVLKNLCRNKTLSACLRNYYDLAGLTLISHAAIGNQNYATTDYRYQGKTPNNYITFNDETGLWRIIGVFEVETPNGSGYTKEYKVKLIRDTIGASTWNSVQTGTSYNDWTTATLMTTLNSGEYYNRNGTYERNGLTNEAKNQISSTKWYLGIVTWGTGAGKDSFGTYQEERSTNVWSGNSQTWNGKVALLYPSDYMYASSACYNVGTIGYYYNDSTCINSNWLFLTYSWFWTLSTSSHDSYYTMVVSHEGLLTDYNVANGTDGGLRQSLYLDTNIKYLGGDGTSDNPFVIE